MRGASANWFWLPAFMRSPCMHHALAAGLNSSHLALSLRSQRSGGAPARRPRFWPSEFSIGGIFRIAADVVGPTVEPIPRHAAAFGAQLLHKGAIAVELRR